MSQSKILTSNDLIDSLKRRSMSPSSNSTFGVQDYLDILNEEMDMYVIPYLLQVHEDYLLTYEDQSFSIATSRFKIPYRSIGNRLKTLLYFDGSISTQNPIPYEFTRISADAQAEFQGYFSGKNYVFYVEGDEVVLTSKPLLNTTQGYLRMFFYLRPNKLVENSRAGIISSIDRVTGVVGITSWISDFTASPEIDFIAARSPNKVIDYDITPASVDANLRTLTFALTDIPSTLAVGDYINVAGETIVPQLPTELHALLAQKACLTCLEALGDTEMVDRTKEKLTAMEQKLFSIIDNRVESSCIKAVNRYSPLREVVGRYNKRNKWFIS